MVPAPRLAHTKRRRRIAALGLLLVASTALQPTLAWSERKASADLGTIDKIAVGISQITPDGVQCGLDPAQLLQVARQALGNAGVVVRDDGATRLTLSTITDRESSATADQCATATMAGVYRSESIFSAEGGWLETGFVVLWQRSLVRMTPAASHPAAVAASVRRIVAQFLIDRDAQRRSGSTSDGTKPLDPAASIPDDQQ